MSDKDYDTYLKITAPLFGKIIATECSNPRCKKAQVLCECAKRYCENVEACEDKFGAIDRALSSGGAVLVCGSLYLASEVREYLIGKFRQI